MSLPAIVGVPRARPIVELGIGQSWDTGGTGAVWNTSLWDDATSTWQGLYPSFVDVTCETIDVETFCGRERLTDLFEVGTATITLRNYTGWADYPPTVETPSQVAVRPGVAVRVAVALDGDPGDGETLWFGYIDAATPDYLAGEGDVVVCDCIDAKGETGRAELADLAAGVGAGEGTSARIGRILDAADWPAVLRDLATDAIPLVATTLGAATIDLLNLAAQSAGGDVFADLDGNVVYRAADWQTFDFDAPLDATIGPYTPPDYVGLDDPEHDYLFDPAPVTYVEDPAGSGLWMLFDPAHQLLEDPAGTSLFIPTVIGPPVVCPSQWELSNSRGDFATQVIVGTEAIAPMTFTDAIGKALYGLETFTLTDLETQNAAHLTTIGERLLITRGYQTAPRINAVMIDAATAANTVDVLAYADPRLPSLYQCRHVDYPAGIYHERFNRTMLVTSVQHTIDAESWVCRIGLDDAAPWRLGPGSGRWDTTGVWDDSVWSQHWET